MTPDEIRGGYGAVLMIGEADRTLKDVDGTVEWHRKRNLWLAGRQWSKLTQGMPVVARMAGESNELLMLGTVAGDWEPIRGDYAGWHWEWEIAVAWEQHVVRGVYALDVLGSLGKSRPAVSTLSKRAWRHVVNSLLDG
jgi:hypothetical protein